MSTAATATNIRSYTAKRTRVQVPDSLRKVVELAPALVGGERKRRLVSIPRASSSSSVRAQTFWVPVGDAGDVGVVEAGTVVVILLSFLYLLRAIVRAFRRGRSSGASHVSVTRKDS
jgi:hypothetical protein